MLTRGAAVQTPLGKGIVRELRNHGRVLVEVRGRATEFAAGEVSPLGAAAGRARGAGSPSAPRDQGLPSRDARACGADVDLHGLTIDAALARTDEALNEALLAGRLELRVIHGRGGGRLKAALHRHLREISSVRGFHLDPRNAGVTVVAL